MTADLIDLAVAGDEEAFRRLVAPFERELKVHCYRMLGSFADAEDALQDALLAAWQGLPGFEGRASVRTWLYRVATSRCLNARRSAQRRQGSPGRPGTPTRQGSPGRPGTLPPGTLPPALAAAHPPAPTRLGEVTWLEPCPDSLLEGLADAEPGPEARYEAREAISLAFVTAVQRLPPRQRAVLLLRDVLGFPASEAARILGAPGEVTVESVTSALKRARATLRTSPPDPTAPPPAPGSPVEKDLVERLTRAYEAGDVDAIIALFADDAWLTMPPVPLEYQGHAPIRAFLAAIAFRDGRTYRLVPARANGQLAFAAYLRHPKGDESQANGLHVLTLTTRRSSDPSTEPLIHHTNPTSSTSNPTSSTSISNPTSTNGPIDFSSPKCPLIQAMTRFPSSVFPRFGLPPS
ncbi:MAG TPA: RNA polymerase subunit sigma-70 [Streptosporangiaceae bacterium]|nr:RNA polymerase subunit sigma-70 [Streptosporangiaceae bacterium]